MACRLVQYGEHRICNAAVADRTSGDAKFFDNGSRTFSLMAIYLSPQI